MPTLNKELMRTIIMTHYETPYHKLTPQNRSEFQEMHLQSSGCIDDITLYLLIKEDQVKEAYFDGSGCTLSISSTSILVEMIENKSLDEVIYLTTEYQKMLNGETYDEDLLGEAIVFMNTSRQPSRLRCALIGWQGASAIIDAYREKEGK